MHRRHLRRAVAALCGLCVPLAAGAADFPPLSGRLFFGAVETRFTAVRNDPAAGATPAGEDFLTSLAVETHRGSLTRHPEWTYGDGTPLPVRLDASGDAWFTDTVPVRFTRAGPDTNRVGNVRFRFAKLQGHDRGLRALEAVVVLPPGCGLARDTTARLFEPFLPFGDIAVDGDLQPVQPLIRLDARDLGSASLAFHCEQLPLVLGTDAVLWRVAEGLFEIPDGRWEFTRADALAFLEQPGVAVAVPAESAVRWSNDHSLRRAAGLLGKPVRILVDAAGQARIEGRAELQPASFQTHFPRGLRVEHTGGTLTLSNGAVVLAESSLGLPPGPVLECSWKRDCPEPTVCAAHAPPGLVQFAATDATLHFTTDLGLAAAGSVTGTAGQPARVEWGALDATRFAVTLEGITAGRVYLPGFQLAAEAATEHLPPGDLPAVLLHTGHRPDLPAPHVERPLTTDYLDGAGDYAGLNIRAAGNSGVTAFNHVAGQRVPGTGTYALTDNSKYYLRPGGVSGRHQAHDGPFASGLRLYGFPTRLDGWRLSYLDNEVQRSATDGAIQVPFPSDFTQEFAGLRVRCNGQLWDAELAGDAEHTLSYWLAPFRAVTMEFRTPGGAPCSTTSGALLLGAAVKIPLSVQRAQGILGFWPDGTLVATGSVPGVDSRLRLPTTLKIDAGNDLTWVLQPVSAGYLNAWPGAGQQPESGFLNFAAKMRLPYFLDAKVHLQAIGGGPRPELHVMGGWSPAGEPNDPARAWVDASGRSFFELQDFDPANRGFPLLPGRSEADSLAIYRDSGTEQFRPRARQSILNLPEARMDLPLRWETAGRAFGSGGPQTANLLVFSLQGQADTLTPRRAHLSFAASVGKEVPKFSASEFLLGQIEGRTALFSTVSNALSTALHNNDVAERLRRGADDLDRVVSPRLDQLLNEPLRQVLDPMVDQLLTDISQRAASGATTATNIQLALCEELSRTGNALAVFCGATTNGTNLVFSASRRILDGLRSADDAVTSFVTVVEFKTNAQTQIRQREVVGEIVKRIIDQQGAAADPATRGLHELARTGARGQVDAAIQDYLGQELNEPLGRIEQTARDVHADLSDLVRQLQSLDGEFGRAFRDLGTPIGWLSQFRNNATNALCREFAAETEPLVLTLKDRDRLKRRLDRVLLSELLAGVMPREMNLLVRQFLVADRGLFRAALNDLFVRVNDTLVGVATGPLREPVERITGPFDAQVIQALGQLRDTLEGSRLHGSADIEDETLRRLRVDGEFQFGLGNGNAPLALTAWYEIQTSNGDSPAVGCLPPGEISAQVAFGGGSTPREGFAAGLEVLAAGQFLVKKTGGTPELLGLAGRLGIKGTKTLEAAEMDDPQLSLAFGRTGSYLAGTGAGRFHGIAMKLRLFAGRACRLEDLRLFDSFMLNHLAGAGVPANGEFIGFYVQADGSAPLEKFLPIPAPPGCYAHLQGEKSWRVFGFYLPAMDQLRAGYGLRHKLHGNLLCILTGDGELSGIGSVAANLRGQAGADFTAEGQITGGVCVPVLGCVNRTQKFSVRVRLTTAGVQFDPLELAGGLF
jgi:hypothetical protein